MHALTVAHLIWPPIRCVEESMDPKDLAALPWKRDTQGRQLLVQHGESARRCRIMNRLQVHERRVLGRQITQIRQTPAKCRQHLCGM